MNKKSKKIDIYIGKGKLLSWLGRISNNISKSITINTYNFLYNYFIISQTIMPTPSINNA
jgi:hypothetical protein